MKVVILAGGRGTRLSEETFKRPKPMVKIGGMPLLWHLMKYYESYDHDEFIVCVGYLGYQIKEYFAHYALHRSERVIVDLNEDSVILKREGLEKWKVTILETGLDTTTGGRIKRALDEISPDDKFFISYGDVLGNVDLNRLVDVHNRSGASVTVTAGRPPAKYGSLRYKSAEQGDDYLVAIDFSEKPKEQFGLVSAGFFVCDKSIGSYLSNDREAWEDAPLRSLCYDGRVSIYNHDGYWQPMDTARDKEELEKLWGENGEMAPWKNWI
jgi:glucose-1-phosphate cytidylyltransferase